MCKYQTPLPQKKKSKFEVNKRIIRGSSTLIDRNYFTYVDELLGIKNLYKRK